MKNVRSTVMLVGNVHRANVTHCTVPCTSVHRCTTHVASIRARIREKFTLPTHEMSFRSSWSHAAYWPVYHCALSRWIIRRSTSTLILEKFALEQSEEEAIFAILGTSKILSPKVLAHLAPSGTERYWMALNGTKWHEMTPSNRHWVTDTR